MGLAALGAADQSQCDPNTEEWNDCGSQCAERVCCDSDPKGHCKDKNCPEECTPMCECIKAFARLPNGMCIPKDDCLASLTTEPMTVGAANGGGGMGSGGMGGTMGSDGMGGGGMGGTNGAGWVDECANADAIESCQIEMSGVCRHSFCHNTSPGFGCHCDISSTGVSFNLGSEGVSYFWEALGNNFGDDGNILYHVDILIDNAVEPKAAVQERFKYKNIHNK